MGEEFFGEERLLATLAEAQGAVARDTVAGVLAAVRGFAAGAKQNDDITILAARYAPRHDPFEPSGSPIRQTSLKHRRSVAAHPSSGVTHDLLEEAICSEDRTPQADSRVYRMWHADRRAQGMVQHPADTAGVRPEGSSGDRIGVVKRATIGSITPQGSDRLQVSLASAGRAPVSLLRSAGAGTAQADSSSRPAPGQTAARRTAGTSRIPRASLHTRSQSKSRHQVRVSM